jgi:hypothetical protein
MADDDNTDPVDPPRHTDPAPGNDIAELRRQLANAQARLRDVNAESRGHRLQADNFKQEAADLRTRLDTAIATHNTALEAAKTQADAALDSLRTELGQQLESTRTELTGKLTETEQKAADREAKAKARSMMADLKVAAKDAGMVDLDGLKLLNTEELKITDEGDVENAAEVLTKLKEAKPYLFGNPAHTSNPAEPPKPNSTEKKKGMELSEAEWKQKQRELQMGIV